jgi:hypothetical protein
MPGDNATLEKMQEALDMIVANQVDSDKLHIKHVSSQVDKIVSSLESIDIISLTKSVATANEKAKAASISADKAHSRIDTHRNFGGIGVLIAGVIAYFLGE